MPVRYVEVSGQDGQFFLSNLDWQAPVKVCGGDGSETELQLGQTLPLEDGAELLLSGGWTIGCRIVREGDG
jgi:hypothetical protein